MTIVFISYSHHDLPTARRIHKAIAAVGLSCWQDERWLQPGDDFAEEITRAIRQCDALILLLSPASNSSDYVCKEVAIAHYFHKPIIPVLLERGNIADPLLPYVIRLHYWDFAQHSASDFATQLKAQLDLGAGGTAFAAHARDQRLAANRPTQQPLLTPQVRLVTNIEYHDFLQSSGLRGPHHWGPSDAGFPQRQSDSPVTRISWDDAVAYCDWAGGCLPGADGRSTQEGPVTTTADGSETLEWCDAGTERHKQVRDPRSSHMTAIVDREARLHNVGFRCTDVPAPPPRKSVWIEGGPCELGSDAVSFGHLSALYRLPLALRQAILRRQVQPYSLRSFAVSATCVTNDEFYEFARATGRPWPCHWDARWLNRWNRPFPVRLASRPVVNVSAGNADAYCIWSRTRLPAWMEWERAASGPARQAYPWGADYSAARTNSMESGRGSLAAVDECPPGDSCEGVRQLCGNVAEWVVGPEGRFETRGGSYRTPCELWGLAYAFRQPDVGFHAPDVGFRVVTD
jgi:formylglycine-generating enzyme required for sulfatase activity